MSISLLLNGTRRLYFANNMDKPPTDISYMADQLEFILTNMARLLAMLAEHGITHVFLPSYSEAQEARHPEIRKYLLKGLQALTTHPDLVQVYQQYNYGVRFYGDPSALPSEVSKTLTAPPRYTKTPEHFIYYGVDSGNPHDYIFQLSYAFSRKVGRAPKVQEMREIYYGDANLRPLDILVAFNRIYARLGIPPLLDGNDRIYATVVSPLELTQTALRGILHDRLYNTHNVGRDYLDLSPEQLERLKAFYSVNRDTVMGLLQSYEGLTFPLPAPNWPAAMGRRRL
ncbi:MAG: hypothetical protein U0694_20880 [Anaerolineae bacterium]